MAYNRKVHDTVTRWGRFVENQIQEAMQRGDFNRLKSQGKRLNYEDSDQAGEQWVANHIMEQNDALPEWLGLRKDVARERQTARRYRDEAEERIEQLPNRLWPTDARLRRLTDLYRKQARKVNLMIDQHNHCCPSIQHELVRIREDAIDRKREEVRRRRAKEYAQRSGDEPVR